jgi:hypothetical protein
MKLPNAARKSSFRKSQLMSAVGISVGMGERPKSGRVAVRRDLDHQWTFKDSLSQFSGSDG